MDITDILIHVHPTLSAEQRAKIEEALSGSKGVVSAHFSTEHPHVLTGRNSRARARASSKPATAGPDSAAATSTPSPRRA